MSTEKDWNAIFAEEMAAQKLDRAQKLKKAKAAAHTDKEPFDAKRFRKLYARLNPDDVDKYTPWETLIKESEYDYYVVQTEKMNLEEYIKHLVWDQGWS